jgi:hypothetical protein
VKFLLDQGLPRTAVKALGRVGFDAVHTGAIGLAKATFLYFCRMACCASASIGAVSARIMADFLLNHPSEPRTTKPVDPAVRS